jgi:hypothetical protein
MDDPGGGSLDCCLDRFRDGHIETLATVIFDRLRECDR